MLDSTNATSNAVQGIYNALQTQITAKAAQAFIDNADAILGLESTQDGIRNMIADNEAKLENVEDGKEVVQENQDSVSTIAERVERIQVLANQAASGDYTAEEVAAMQTEYETLIDEIDALAEGEVGETSNFLDSDGDSYTIAVSDSVSISVKTEDMTSDGLGLADLDLANNPTAAQLAADNAADDVADYATYLEGKQDTLEAFETTLEIQATTLDLADNYIDSIDSAMVMLNMLTGNFPANSQLMYLAQANLASDTVANLLNDSADES